MLASTTYCIIGSYSHLSSPLLCCRLLQMETDVRAVAADLSLNREALLALKSAMMDNLATMQDNVALVNEKMTIIGSSSSSR